MRQPLATLQAWAKELGVGLPHSGFEPEWVPVLRRRALEVDRIELAFAGRAMDLRELKARDLRGFAANLGLDAATPWSEEELLRRVNHRIDEILFAYRGLPPPTPLRTPGAAPGPSPASPGAAAPPPTTLPNTATAVAGLQHVTPMADQGVNRSWSAELGGRKLFLKMGESDMVGGDVNATAAAAVAQALPGFRHLTPAAVRVAPPAGGWGGGDTGQLWLRLGGPAGQDRGALFVSEWLEGYEPFARRWSARVDVSAAPLEDRLRLMFFEALLATTDRHDGNRMFRLTPHGGVQVATIDLAQSFRGRADAWSMQNAAALGFTGQAVRFPRALLEEVAAHEAVILEALRRTADAATVRWMEARLRTIKDWLAANPRATHFEVPTVGAWQWSSSIPLGI